MRKLGQIDSNTQLGLAVKGSSYIVFMPVQPNGKFCPSDQNKD